MLSCGVLEHVPDGSLSEIRRVLAPGGRLLIYNLPQRWSYKELLIKGLQAGYAHERRYTLAALSAALRRNRLRLVRARGGGVLPHLGTGLPRGLKRLYESRPEAVIAADRGLSRLPLVSHIGQSLEKVAEGDLRYSVIGSRATTLIGASRGSHRQPRGTSEAVPAPRTASQI